MPPHATEAMATYAELQAKLAELYIRTFKPEDTDRFLGVRAGTLPLDGETWEHFRHGRGVRFTSARGVVVNAHVWMARHPRGIDPGRLFEYFESIGLTSVAYGGAAHDTSAGSLRNLIDRMSADGQVARAAVHPTIYELTNAPDAAPSSGGAGGPP